MKRNDSMSIIVHDFAVVGPIPAANISLAKGLAAERARQVLEDPESPYLLSKICDCKKEQEEQTPSVHDDLGDIEETKRLDDETEAGFAALARAALAEIQAPEVELTNGDPTNTEHETEILAESADLDGEAIVDEDSMDIDPKT